MGFPTMTLSWSSALLKKVAFSTGFAPSLELPLDAFRTCSPFITILGLGVIVWWRNNRDGAGMRRFVEVSVEMPTMHTLSYVLGYLTATLLVLDVQILMLLLPVALLGTCNFRLSTPKSTDVGCESVTPRAQPETTSNSPYNSTPPNSRRSKKLFHIHSEDETMSPLARGATPTSSLLTPPATLPRRRHLSYAPQPPPVPLTERPSFRTRVSSTPSHEIRRTRKGLTNRRYASEACEENLVPKKDVWDTSFEILLYNLSKSRSRNSSIVQPHPRFDVSSPMPPLAPSPIINSS